MAWWGMVQKEEGVEDSKLQAGGHIGRHVPEDSPWR